MGTYDEKKGRQDTFSVNQVLKYKEKDTTQHIYQIRFSYNDI